jgi:hypothetical protein
VNRIDLTPSLEGSGRPARQHFSAARLRPVIVPASTIALHSGPAVSTRLWVVLLA